MNTLTEFVGAIHTYMDDLVQYDCYSLHNIFVADFEHCAFEGSIRIAYYVPDDSYYFKFTDEYDIDNFKTQSKTGFVSELKKLDKTIKGDWHEM